MAGKPRKKKNKVGLPPATYRPSRGVRIRQILRQQQWFYNFKPSLLRLRLLAVNRKIQKLSNRATQLLAKPPKVRRKDLLPHLTREEISEHLERVKQERFRERLNRRAHIEEKLGELYAMRDALGLAIRKQEREKGKKP